MYDNAEEDGQEVVELGVAGGREGGNDCGWVGRFDVRARQ